MNLMSADREKVYMHFCRINSHFSIGLNGIHMKKRLWITLFDQCPRFRDRLHRSDFIIYLHEGNQNGIRPDCRFQIVQRNHTISIYRKICDFISVFLQICHRCRHGRMFNGRRYHMFSTSLVCLCHTDNCKIIGLSTT